MKFRRIAFLLAAACLLCGCEKAEEPENPYWLKSQTYETYHDEVAFLWRFENVYDEKGWLAEQLEYENDVPDTKTLYEHDAYGNIVRTTTIQPDGTQDVAEDKLTLDEQHRVVCSESTWNREPTGITEYGYNDAGQITRLYINRIGALNEEDWKSFVDRTYDRKGRLIREDTRWEPDHNDSSYTLYHYEKDDLLRTETYKGEELDNYTDYTYDETGRIQTAISYESDGTLRSKHITTFDEYGNKLEVVSYAYASELIRSGMTDEEPDSRTTYVYEIKE